MMESLLWGLEDLMNKKIDKAILSCENLLDKNFVYREVVKFCQDFPHQKFEP